MHVNSGVYRNQKRVQNLLGLELEVIVSHLTCVPSAGAAATADC